LGDLGMSTEGWGVVRPGDRRAHYYRDMTALCRRVGFYNGPLEPNTKASPDDCAACRKRLGPPVDITVNSSKV